jgi:hypothetical protein
MDRLWRAFDTNSFTQLLQGHVRVIAYQRSEAFLIGAGYLPFRTRESVPRCDIAGMPPLLQ